MSEVSPNLALFLMFLFKIIPIFFSGMAVYLGYRLFIRGVTGEASLIVKTKSVSGRLINAAPGLFFGVGGIIALILSIWKGFYLVRGQE